MNRPTTPIRTDGGHDAASRRARRAHDADLPLGEGYVEFEPETSQAFRQLVRETLTESDFIDTEWVGDQLVISEV